MWILLYRLRCSRNSALPYFHKIKLNFILRSYSTRLTEIQFLSLLRSSPAHAKLPREHSGRSCPEVTAHAGSFWVSPCPNPLGLESCESGGSWSSRFTSLGGSDGQCPHPLPRAFLSPPGGVTVELGTGLPTLRTQTFIASYPFIPLFYPVSSQTH